MAKYDDNYRSSSETNICPLCYKHSDLQYLCVKCPIINDNIDVQGRYEDIFSPNINLQIIRTIENIHNFREGYLESRRIN